MKVHNISIDRKYYEPIRNGKITLLIFDKKVIQDGEIGDYILASHGSYDVKSRIVKAYVKAFENITEEEARKSGFITKDFLKDELINRFDLKATFSFELGSSIDNELFYIIEIANDKEEPSSEKLKFGNLTNVNLYSKEYNKEFYNPEYDAKPWRDI